MTEAMNATIPPLPSAYGNQSYHYISRYRVFAARDVTHDA
jgi:hypothetical protein